MAWCVYIWIYRTASSTGLARCVRISAGRAINLRIVLTVVLGLAHIRIVLGIVLLDGGLLYWRCCVVLRIVRILLLTRVLRLRSEGRLSRRREAGVVSFLPLLSLPTSLCLILAVCSLPWILRRSVLSLITSVLVLLAVWVIRIIVALLLLLLPLPILPTLII
jgi:hypothetical protein